MLRPPVRSSHLPRGAMAAGAVFGLAWASAMRAMMAELAARDPGGSHLGIATFVFILPPGAVMGALMAWALTPRQPGTTPPPARLRWAPMVMCLDPAALPIMLAVVGVGWVAAGRGTPRSRLGVGIPSSLALLALPVAIAISAPPVWASLRTAWILTLATSLLASLVVVETAVVRHVAAPAPAEQGVYP